MGMTLAVAKTQLQQKLYKALYDALLNTFPTVTVNGIKSQGGSEAQKIADKFAKESSSAIANAIYEFVKEANITGTLTGIVTAAGAMGPVTGTNIDTFTGTELSLI